MLECPLCRLVLYREIIAPLHYEDAVCMVVNCYSHPNRVLIVLKRHTPTPSKEEEASMEEVAKKLFPSKRFRGPKSILDHWHLHEEV